MSRTLSSQLSAQTDRACSFRTIVAGSMNDSKEAMMRAAAGAVDHYAASASAGAAQAFSIVDDQQVKNIYMGPCCANRM